MLITLISLGITASLITTRAFHRLVQQYGNWISSDLCDGQYSTSSPISSPPTALFKLQHLLSEGVSHA
jgi:hypothetical protein